MRDKFRNVNRNYKTRIIPPLKKERNRNIITSPDEVADYYANTLRDPHKKSKPGKNRKRKKKSYYSQTEN